MKLDRISRNALSIGVASGVYAIAFGALSVSGGLNVAQTCVMSLATFTGASQFTYVSIVGTGGGLAGALPPALLLAARNGIYAVSLGRLLRGGPARRAVEAQLVIDESTAMAQAQETPGAKRVAFSRTGLAVFVCWNLGTLAGALAGQGLGDPRDLGLDAMFPAVFLALLAPQIDSPRTRAAAIGGGVIALSLISFTPAGLPIIASALVIPPLVLLGRFQARSRS